MSMIRYRLIRAYYALRHSLGGPDFVDELEYWEGILGGGGRSKLMDRANRQAAVPEELRSCAAELRRDGIALPRLLEVGSGPVSILASAVDEGLLSITAIDPLAVAYRELLRAYGVEYPVRPQPGRGESLDEQFPSASFDIVYSSNALDHTTSPRRCMEQMCRVLRPGGFLLLEGLEREGSTGDWLGLHQHDLFTEHGDLIHVDRAGRRDNLTADQPLVCISERVRKFRERGILAFGYEVPPDMPPDAPWDWRNREWYSVLFQRQDG
jgi:SAM-dependent methyltransferase